MPLDIIEELTKILDNSLVIDSRNMFPVRKSKEYPIKSGCYLDIFVDNIKKVYRF